MEEGSSLGETSIGPIGPIRPMDVSLAVDPGYMASLLSATNAAISPQPFPPPRSCAETVRLGLLKLLRPADEFTKPDVVFSEQEECSELPRQRNSARAHQDIHHVEPRFLSGLVSVPRRRTADPRDFAGSYGLRSDCRTARIHANGRSDCFSSVDPSNRLGDLHSFSS